MFDTHATTARATYGRSLKHGMSLFEILIAISVIGIMAAVAVPKFAAHLQVHQIEMAAKRLATDIETAKSIAYHSSSPRTIRFNIAQSTYQIVGLIDSDKPITGTSYTVNLTDAPYYCNLKNLNLAGSDTMTFNGHGLPTTSGSVEVRSGKLIRTVTIDAATGIVTVL